MYRKIQHDEESWKNLGTKQGRLSGLAARDDNGHPPSPPPYELV